MLDVLSLPAAISQSSAVKDAIETELPTELQVLTSWKRLLEVLGYIFDQSGCTSYSTILAPMKGAKSRSVVSSETVNIGCQDNLQEGMKIQVCTKIFCVMSQLLAAASREETASIFDQIIQLVYHACYLIALTLPVRYISCSFSLPGLKFSRVSLRILLLLACGSRLQTLPGEPKGASQMAYQGISSMHLTHMRWVRMK